VALSLLLSTHPCAPLSSSPSFLLTTSPSPAPLTSVRERGESFIRNNLHNGVEVARLERTGRD